MFIITSYVKDSLAKYFSKQLVSLVKNHFSDHCLLLFIGPAKVNTVKIFLGSYYMIKQVLTFVSSLQESVLVDFISQNKVKILYKVKLVKIIFIKNFLTLTLTKMKKT